MIFFPLIVAVIGSNINKHLFLATDEALKEGHSLEQQEALLGRLSEVKTNAEKALATLDELSKGLPEKYKDWIKGNSLKAINAQLNIVRVGQNFPHYKLAYKNAYNAEKQLRETDIPNAITRANWWRSEVQIYTNQAANQGCESLAEKGEVYCKYVVKNCSWDAEEKECDQFHDAQEA